VYCFICLAKELEENSSPISSSSYGNHTRITHILQWLGEWFYDIYSNFIYNFSIRQVIFLTVKMIDWLVQINRVNQLTSPPNFQELSDQLVNLS